MKHKLKINVANESPKENYMKQVNQVWFQIYQVVKDNCSADIGGANPQDDLMERLLQARKR